VSEYPHIKRFENWTRQNVSARLGPWYPFNTLYRLCEILLQACLYDKLGEQHNHIIILHKGVYWYWSTQVTCLLLLFADAFKNSSAMSLRSVRLQDYGECNWNICTYARLQLCQNSMRKTTTVRITTPARDGLHNSSNEVPTLLRRYAMSFGTQFGRFERS